MSKPDEATRLRRQMHEQRVTLRSQTKQIERLRTENATFRRNLRDAWAALDMVREAVETLGPVGAMPSEEHVACAIAPKPDAEAAAIIEGVQKIAAAEREACALLAETSKGYPTPVSQAIRARGSDDA